MDGVHGDLVQGGCSIELLSEEVSLGGGIAGPKVSAGQGAQTWNSY